MDSEHEDNGETDGEADNAVNGEIGSEINNELYALLRRLGRQLHRLSHPGGHWRYGRQSAMLRLIGGNDGIVLRDLAERMDMRPPSVTEAVLGLEAQGLIARVQDERDRRLVHIRLTAAGASVLNEAEESEHELTAALFGDLSRDEITQLRDLVRKLCEGIDSHDGGEPDELRIHGHERGHDRHCEHGHHHDHDRHHDRGRDHDHHHAHSHESERQEWAVDRQVEPSNPAVGRLPAPLQGGESS